MEKKIGVSYAFENKKQLDLLADKLYPLGIKIVRYDKELKVKDDIKKYMQTLSKLDVNFLLLSRDYFKSAFCVYELTILNKNIDKLIIIYLEKEITVEVLLEEAKESMAISYQGAAQWLKEELCTFDVDEVLKNLQYTLKQKYMSYDEIVSNRGIRQILEMLQHTPDGYLDRLDQIVAKGNFCEREKEFVEYLKFAPANEIYNYYKALSYEKEDYIDGTVFFLEQAIELNPKYILPYIKLIDLSFKYPNEVILDEKLLQYLEQIEDLSLSDRIMIHKAKGMLLFHRAKTMKQPSQKATMKKALEHLQQANKLGHNEDATIYNNIGLVYEVLEEIELAVAAYQEAVKMFPRYYQAWCNLALLYDKYYGEIQLSRRMYEICLKIKPDYLIAKSNYALLMEKVDIKKAMEMDLDILCDPHTRTDYITNLALIFEEEGMSSEVAEILYRNVLKKTPESLTAQFNLGNFLRRKGQPYNEVLQYLKPVQQQMPDNDMVLFTMALLEMQKGDLGRALVYCDNAIRCNKDYTVAFFLKGYLCEKQGCNRKQLLYFMKKIAEDIGEKEATNGAALVYNFIAILLAKEAESEEAVNWHTKAININRQFEKELDVEKPYYGLDILEYEYPHAAKGRIYKHRIENLKLDEHKESLLHLLSVAENEK